MISENFFLSIGIVKCIQEGEEKLNMQSKLECYANLLSRYSDAVMLVVGNLHVGRLRDKGVKIADPCNVMRG